MKEFRLVLLAGMITTLCGAEAMLLLEDDFNRADSSQVGGEWRTEQDGITGCLIPFPDPSLSDNALRIIVGYDEHDVGGTGKARIKKKFESTIVTRVSYDYTPIRDDTLGKKGVGVHVMFETSDSYRYGIKYFYGDYPDGYNDVYEDSTVRILLGGEFDGEQRSVDLNIDSILDADFGDVFDRDSVVSATVAPGLHSNECYSHAEVSMDNVKIYGYKLETSSVAGFRAARAARRGRSLLSVGAPVSRSSLPVGYIVPEPGPVRLAVYRLDGSCMEVLVHGYREAGRYTAVLPNHAFGAGSFLLSLTGPHGRSVVRLMR